MLFSRFRARARAKRAADRSALLKFFTYRSQVLVIALWVCWYPMFALGQGNITSNGGTLQLTGSDTGTSSATFGTVTLNGGLSRIIVSNGLGDGMTLNLGLFTRNQSATMDFSVPAAPGAIKTPTMNTDGLFGGYATVEFTDWATLEGVSSPFTVNPISTYTSDVWAPGNQTTVTTSGTPPADSSTTSLRFDEPAALTLTLSSTAGSSNAISSGGILVTPNVGPNDLAISAQSGGASLTSGNGLDLIVHQNNTSASLTLGVPVVDNGATPIGFTHSGLGTLVMSPTALHSYSGPTAINGGVLSASGIGNAGDGGGTPSHLGQSSNAAENLRLNGGTLRYTGPATSTDRLLSLGTSGSIDRRGGTIESAGSGPITFSNPGPIGFSLSIAHLPLTLSGSNTGDNTFAPLIEDHLRIISPTREILAPTSLVKSGVGTWILTNANTYTDGTTIEAGTLLVANVDGSATGTGPVSVNPGATLGGSGTIDGPVTFQGAVLAPGSSAGTLTLQSALFDAGAILEYEFDTPGLVGGQVNDLVEIVGELTLDGTLNVTALDNFSKGPYRLFNYGGSLTDNGLEVGPLPGGLVAIVDTSVTNQVNLLVSIPEPSTLTLAVLGFATFLMCAPARRNG